ncbi:MAG: hypothetical protein KDC07_08950, partial [Chitinophagaceae bacterium]|nr:hypothetical protein [Chitinophagaceae bacterium]
KRPFAIFYYIITHNIRITRELNNIQLEQGSADEEVGQDVVLRQQKLIADCDRFFVKNVSLLKSIDPASDIQLLSDGMLKQPHMLLSSHQEIYLEKMLVELKAMNNDLEILAEKLPRIMQL